MALLLSLDACRASSTGAPEQTAQASCSLPEHAEAALLQLYSHDVSKAGHGAPCRSTTTTTTTTTSTTGSTTTTTTTTVALTDLWTTLVGSASEDDVNNIATDTAGSIYIAGNTECKLKQSTAEAQDAYISKLDTSGNVLWTTLVGSASEDDWGHGVAPDAQGNIYLSGHTRGNFSHQTNAGKVDAFVSKLDAAGNVLWTTFVGSASFDYSYGAATDAAGSIYIAGNTDGNLQNQTNAGSHDAFVSKLDADGNVQWTTLVGSASNDYGRTVATDAEGNIYLAGETRGNLSSQPNSGSHDVFVSKLDPAGKVQWTKQVGSDSSDEAKGVATDTGGNIYVAGTTRGTSFLNQTNAGNADAFVIKLDTSGNVQWTKLVGSTLSEQGNAVATDAEGNIYLAGYTSSSSLSNQTNAGRADAFVSKLDADGNVQWTRLVGSDEAEYCYGVATAAGGSVYITGQTDGELLNQTNAGSFDAFVTRLRSDGATR